MFRCLTVCKFRALLIEVEDKQLPRVGIHCRPVAANTLSRWKKRTALLFQFVNPHLHPTFFLFEGKLLIHRFQIKSSVRLGAVYQSFAVSRRLGFQVTSK